MVHTAEQINGFDLPVKSWEKPLHFFFFFNIVSYDRYSSYYVHTVKSMENLHPGLKDMLNKICLSVQAQDPYPVRTVQDQRREQTINRDTKTSGGTKVISTNSFSILKWYLNRFEQATNTKALDNLAGIPKNNSS